MHTSKPFPYRPAVVARQDKPLSGSGALSSDDADVVPPDYDAPYRWRPRVGEAPGPLPRDPQPALIQPQVVHQPAPAPRPPRASRDVAPSHPALPPLSEANPYGTRVRAYCPVGMTLACAALIAAGLLAIGARVPLYGTPTHVTVDNWCSEWPAGLSCEQKAGKQK